MAGDAPNTVNDVAGAAAAPFAITTRHKQVAVTNLHATQILTVRAFTGTTSAFSKTKATATPAVIGADDNYTINPGQRVVVVKSGRRVYTSISVIASGAATPFMAAGEDWTD